MSQFAADMEAYFERAARGSRTVQAAFAASQSTALYPFPLPIWDGDDLETVCSAESDQPRPYPRPALAYAV